MSLWTLNKNDIAITLNSLFDDDIIIKPLVTMPAKENPKEFNFVLIDLHEWLVSMLDFKGTLYNIDRDILQRYFDKFQSKMFFANLSGTSDDIDARIDFLGEDFFTETEKLYKYFLKYMEECQFKLFDIYNVNRRTTAVPLLPFSYVLNRYSNQLYEINELKSPVKKHMNDETEYGMNNKYELIQMVLDDGFPRTSKDLKIRLYHVASSARDTSPMTKRWVEQIEKLNPEMKSYESRVDMIKKLYTQYMYVGSSRITYSDETTEEMFLLNFPIYIAMNMDMGRIPTKDNTIEFKIR